MTIPDLYLLDTFIEREHITIYADVSNSRFWMLHSANRSISLDWLLDRMLKEQNFLDHAWLWPNMLDKISRKGSFKGLGLDFDRQPVPDVDFDSSKSVEYLKLQLWGTASGDVLKVLSERFPQHTTLSKVKIKYWLSNLGGDQFSIDDFKFDGKITARGTSFICHLSLISDAYNDYKNIIRKIEREYSIQWTQDLNKSDSLHLSGKAMAFYFPHPIENLDLFVNTFFHHLYRFVFGEFQSNLKIVFIVSLGGSPRWLSFRF